MPTLYEQLAAMTTIVADTGDIHAIQAVQPRDATTNPSLIAKAARMEVYAPVVKGALEAAKRGNTGKSAILADATDRLAVAFGCRILEVIPGRVSTEVDARLSYDTEGTVAKAHKLIGLYEEAGITRERVLIKIASTWEGIEAARLLERDGIHCNLTLLFGMHQAAACAEAGVTLISPFVGRILDWYKAHTGRDGYPPAEDPGVRSVTRIYHYFKRHGFQTAIMGASFRNLGEILELAGCDLLTIAPRFLHELQHTEGELTRKLDPAQSPSLGEERITMDAATFRAMHAADPMASDKLSEGIAGFTRALEELEAMLAAML